MIKSYTIISSGNISIPVSAAVASPDQVYENNIITGTTTLVGTLTITPAGTPTEGQIVRIHYDAIVGGGGAHNINVFGTDLPSGRIKGDKFTIECVYTGSAWIRNVGDITLDDASILTATIADNNVTNAKLADIARGSVKVGGTSNAPTDLDAKTSGRILVGDGTDIASVAVSGDATLASTGALTLAAGAVEVSHCEADLLYDVITIRTDSKSAAAVGNVNFTMPYKCTITHIVITVLEPTLNDTYTATYKDNGGASMGSIDVPTSMAIGNKATLASSGSPLSANNAFNRDQNFLIEPAKTTKSSGAYLHSIYILKVT